VIGMSTAMQLIDVYPDARIALLEKDFFFQGEDGIRDSKRLLLSPGNTSITPENIAGQSLSVGFRPCPQTTPNRKRSWIGKLNPH
ncbi:hypothetical protein OHW03_19105, partial [Acinetobacter baumannii]|nr:hypothetical protein [Acinetobacter baumannii]